MRFLIDNALSPILSEHLSSAGHDSVHLRDLGIQSAADLEVFERALAEDRVIVSADTDFGTLLALRDTAKPSVVLFRGEAARKPAGQARLLLANLEAIEPPLRKGCIVVFERSRLRIRNLPIGGELT